MPNCRLCNSSSSQTIRAEHVYGGSDMHMFYECADCGAIYLFPPLTIEEEKYFYKKEFEKFMSSRSGTERDWTNAEKHIDTNQDQVARRLRYLTQYIKSGAKILEIGCSTGFMMQAFREMGAECVGIEPSGEFLPFLHENGFRAYESLDDFLSACPDERFDLVVHFFVFEHIREPLEFLKSNVNLLKDGGIVIAEIPSATDILTSFYNIDAFEKFYWSIAHHYYYTPKSLEYLLNKIENINYEILPEQRYDLSNHITWLMEGIPGGHGKFNIFSQDTISAYSSDLKSKWVCDTIILKITKAIGDTFGDACDGGVNTGMPYVSDTAKVEKSILKPYSRLKNYVELIDSELGDYSYISQFSIVNKSIIGKFCSIAHGCFIGLWEHNMDVSTHSFYLYETSGHFVNGYKDYNNSDTTYIGNDVWVGANAVILKGVKVGDGAIVGAGSVVTKDIPPYAIVVGNPARILRYRFDGDDIEFLLKMKWWDSDRITLQRMVDSNVFASLDGLKNFYLNV